MKRIFSPDSPYKKQARFIAIVWTLLIFIGCFTPGKDLPEVDVPFIDKWVHFILFGCFELFWLCSWPRKGFKHLLLMFAIGVGLGAFIEIMQGILAFLGRSCDFWDAVADSVGAILGISLFSLLRYLSLKKS